MKEIQLTKGLVAFIDDDSFDIVSKYKWQAVQKRRGGRFYAATTIRIKGTKNNKKHISMHRFIMGNPIDLQVDHKDGNTLNNQKSNLRLCNNSQNHMNIKKMNKATSSKFKGVSLRKECGKWRSYIRVAGAHKDLGLFDSELEAAMAYNRAAIQFYGEFASLNPL